MAVDDSYTELKNFAEVWLLACASLAYSYASGKLLRAGIPRLLALLPVVFLFLLLPLRLSSIHLSGLTAFFLPWLANFKLLLFAAGRGPLSGKDLSLPRFVAVACLPIKIDGDVYANRNKIEKKSVLNYVVKGVVLAALLRSHVYVDRMSENLVLVVYSFHIYLMLEIILAGTASLARATLGIELEPQFDEPYLSSSLQDFWSRRWNVMVTRILRPTVYEPVISFAERRVGRRWAMTIAMAATFAVSAIMHELVFFYMGRLWPTGELSCFFLLHGVCLIAEIALKRALAGKFHLPRCVSGLLTVVFVMQTGFWLFFPPLLRFGTDVRAFEEYAAVGTFLRNVSGSLGLKGGSANGVI